MSEDMTTSESRGAHRRRTGILVHGYNLHAGQWEDVTWGAPPERIGRVPMGVLVALSEQADVMVFGSGASEKDGLLESAATARLLWERFDELAGFTVFKGNENEWTLPPAAGRFRQWIESILHLDRASKNTRDEIAYAGRVFVEQDVERVVLVSSPTHLPRCLRDACAIYGEDGDMSGLLRELYAAPSGTGYPGYTANDVTIFEPPHRPDRPGADMSRVVSRVHDIPENQRERFVRRLDDLLQEFEV
ncbi:MAG: YdcF family protein [candidate division Zixibacteria bacterium]|nr:YdcF family protein [candidate division Zixibacteria bacterium]